MCPERQGVLLCWNQMCISCWVSSRRPREQGWPTGSWRRRSACELHHPGLPETQTSNHPDLRTPVHYIEGMDTRMICAPAKLTRKRKLKPIASFNRLDAALLASLEGSSPWQWEAGGSNSWLEWKLELVEIGEKRRGTSSLWPLWSRSGSPWGRPAGAWPM